MDVTHSAPSQSGASVAYNEFYAYTDAHAPIDISGGALINALLETEDSESEHVTFNPATGDINLAAGVYSFACSVDLDGAAAGGSLTLSGVWKNINGIPDGNSFRAEGVRNIEAPMAISLVAFAPGRNATYVEIVISRIA